METKDRRVKREIANSNERRRMQSINAGFQKLKRLLPVNDGEKLSKASILQNAADYIEQIERDKLRLIEQNTLFRETLIDIKNGVSSLDTIDIDALPTIPVNTQLAINTNINTSSSSSSSSILSATKSNNHDKNAHNRSDDNTNNNGNNDCIGSIKSAGNKNDSNKETNKSNYSAQSSVNEKSTNQPSSNGVANERSSIAKAAIALPLEVPYTSETAIRVHPPQASPNRKKIKTEPNLDPKQNLDTICKAIMEIEGDRVFNHET